MSLVPVAVARALVAAPRRAGRNIKNFSALLAADYEYPG